MVSPLSSRILNLEAKAKIKNFRPPQTVKQPWQIKNRKKRLSGYLADKERSLSPSQFVNARKQMRADQVKSNAKRKKTGELNFQAHNARQYLSDAGVDFTPGPRTPAHDSIDLSNVELVIVSKEKPYAPKACRNSDQSLGSTSDYSSLINMCKGFYDVGGSNRKIVPLHMAVPKSYVSNHYGTNSDTTGYTSICSSPVDSDSDAENEETHTSDICQVRVDYIEVKCLPSAQNILQSHDEKILSLDDALQGFDDARLIVTSEAPHVIIHVNGPFSRLTTVPSEKMRGQPLMKILKENEYKTVDMIMSQDSDCIEQNKSDDQVSDRMKNLHVKTSQVSCRFDKEKKPIVTHFAIDLFRKDGSFDGIDFEPVKAIG